MCEIYERIVQLGEPYQFAGAWQRMSCDGNFFSLPACRSSLLATLAHEFPADSLIAAGVAVHGAEGELRLAPALQAAGAPVWAIRTGAEQSAEHLIVDLQVLGSGRSPAVVAIQEHGQAGRLAASRGQIFAAYSMHDLAILRTLGLAVIPGPREVAFDGDALSALSTVVRINKGRGDNSTAENPQRQLPRLALCAFSLATCELQPDSPAHAFFELFASLVKLMKLRDDAVEKWLPGPAQLNDLHLGARFLPLDELRARLLASVQSPPPVPPREPPAGPTRSLSRALAELRSLETCREFDQKTIRAKRRKLLDDIKEYYAQPLLELAAAASPLESVSLIALASVFGMQQMQTLEISERRSAMVVEGGLRKMPPPDKEELRAFLSTSSVLLNYVQSLQKCRTVKTKKST